MNLAEDEDSPDEKNDRDSNGDGDGEPMEIEVPESEMLEESKKNEAPEPEDVRRQNKIDYKSIEIEINPRRKKTEKQLQALAQNIEAECVAMKQGKKRNYKRLVQYLKDNLTNSPSDRRYYKNIVEYLLQNSDRYSFVV